MDDWSTDKAYIKIIDPEDAEDSLLKRAYKRIGGERGSIAYVHQSQSLNPKAMMAHLDFYMSIMYQESPLSRMQRELLGVVVSFWNNCNYCVTHHYEALKEHWPEAPNVVSLSKGEGLIRKNQALVMFAKKLTLNAPNMIKQDCNMLRDFDFDDRAVLDITLIIGYFNFVNRLVLGLGVSIENAELRNYKY